MSGFTVNFTDTSTDDGTIVSRSWNFGDGSVSTAVNPSHTYASGGSYNVRLIVTDNDGKSSLIDKNVTIFRRDQSKGIMYIYCIIYGCNSSGLTTNRPTVLRAPSRTPSVSSGAGSSSKSVNNNVGSPSSGTAVATSQVPSQVPVTSGNSSQSFKVASAPRALAAPSNLTVSVLTSGKSKTKTATLNWTDNSSNELEFVIERCEQKGNNKSCNFVELDKVPANTTTYQDVVVNGNYKYRVKARNRFDDSANSKEVKI
jgi:PKD repeat protein